MAFLAVGEAGAVLSPIAGDGDESEALLAGIGRGVVLVTTAGDDADFRALNLWARADLSRSVRIHRCDAPASLLALLTEVLEAGRFGPGDVLEVLTALRAVTTTLVITDSVGKLEQPVPSLWQHLRSALPGARFVIDLPGQRVLSGELAVQQLPRVHAAAVALASADDERSITWRAALRALAGTAPLVELPSVDRSANPWRTRRWAEFTGLAVPVDEFAARLNTYLVRRPCPGCAEPVSGMGCPLCGVVCAVPSPSRPLVAAGMPSGRDSAPTPPAGLPIGGPEPELDPVDLSPPTVRRPNPRVIAP
jgi:hypothetical protein